MDQLIHLRAGLILNTEHNASLSLKSSFLNEHSQGKCSMAIGMPIQGKCSSPVGLLKRSTWKQPCTTGHVLVKIYLSNIRVWSHNCLLLLLLLINTSTVALSAVLQFLHLTSIAQFKLIFLGFKVIYSICIKWGLIYLEADKQMRYDSISLLYYFKNHITTSVKIYLGSV